MATETSGEILNTHFTEALNKRYLSYALSTIMSRSLPDVRDGLKPVHRRLLYAMLLLKLDPKTGFKKCARVVGDVIGKYHPHGDVAVYDTLVRLAQDFTLRYPLIDGQGNFGSIDGDNAAAMRYTEARLTEIALLLLEDIDKETVPFRPTYDGQEEEPVILPAAFPNLLANGSEGIAVGMATSIPPHNLAELCDSLIYLIKNPHADIQELMQFFQGPDFPTGGVIIDNKHTILETYRTGRGSFRVRAKWHQEFLGHGLYQIIITEIPYQVPKSRLIEKIANLLREKKLALLGNIRDESTEDIRLILEPKNRSCDPELLMESLFKLTELESRVMLNMNVLSKENVPQVMNLKEVLIAFLDHRFAMVTKRTEYRLAQIAHRLEILAGLLIAYLNLDEVIRIIREEDEPKAVMIQRWKLSELQTESILNMRLRSLRKLEEIEIKTEHQQLSKEQAELQSLLKAPEKIWNVISTELKHINKRFGSDTALGKRKTTFAEKSAESQVISIEAFVEKEPLTILCSEKGWIRALKGFNEPTDIKYKEGDQGRFTVKAYTTDKLIIFSQTGRFFTLPCDKLPKGKGQGDPIRLIIDLENEDEIVSISVYQPEQTLLIATNTAKGFLVEASEVIAQTRSGKQILNVTPPAKAQFCIPLTGSHIALIGTNRKMVVYPISEIPLMKKGQGVALQKYQQGHLSDIKIFNMEEGLSWKMGERIRTESNLLPWLGKRASSGKLAPMGFPRDNKFPESAQ